MRWRCPRVSRGRSRVDWSWRRWWVWWRWGGWRDWLWCVFIVFRFVIGRYGGMVGGEGRRY